LDHNKPKPTKAIAINLFFNLEARPASICFLLLLFFATQPAFSQSISIVLQVPLTLCFLPLFTYIWGWRRKRDSWGFEMGKIYKNNCHGRQPFAIWCAFKLHLNEIVMK